MIKNKIFAVTVLLLGLTFFSSYSFSQDQQKSNKTPEEIATKKAERMKKNLSLSDAQYKQVYDLMYAKVNDRKNNKEYYKNLDKDARKQMKKEKREEFNKQMQSILNPEQFQKFEEHKKNHKHKKGNKRDKNQNKTE